MKILTKLLVLLAVPTAAFLTFIAQPIIGKILTPRYGGSAGTWMTTSLFFQTALLIGYAFAFWLLNKPCRFAFRFVIALALISPLLAKIPPFHFENWPEVSAILVGLILSVGPALILTTSIGILIQGWVAREKGVIPYYLYGVSNIGSAVALIAYPFWIEPRIPLSTQILALKCLLVLLGVMAALLAWIYSRNALKSNDATSNPPADAEPVHHPFDEEIPWRTIGFWALISFSTCTVMLGAIRLLSGELGSNPLAWVLPLGIYLLSFTFTFTRLWPVWLTTLSLAPFSLVVFGYAWTKGFSSTPLTPWPLTWLLGIVGASCLCGHALLYQSRPAKRFPLFYLIMATGGALAGLCATVVFPAVLARNYEFLGVALLLWAITFLKLLSRQEFFARLSLAASLLTPVGWLIHQRSEAERPPGQKITHLRNYYGAMSVSEAAFGISVSSDTTLHGVQLKGENSRKPTSYYTRESGLGIVLNELQKKPAALRIGVIGLGAGTIATYMRPNDEIVFWEINPLVERIARERFTYLSDSLGRTEVRLEDGRIGVRKDPRKFDVLVVDAFSGDSIPMHLLTTEAIKEYLAKLNDGYLIIHISNRYFNLMPVLAHAANESGRYIVSLAARPPAEAVRAGQASATHYAIIYPPSRNAELEAWVTAAMRSEEIGYDIDPGEGVKPVRWTDERHAIMDVLKD